ncbi:MAG: glycosyltransferase family 2 protein [Candidatus Komeilibacteria bacterium]
MKQPSIAISLVTYNAAHYLPFCLQSLQQQTYKNWQLLIIDNGSSDNTIAYLSENWPQYKVVSHQDNLGFSKAHNQAIAWTGGEYVLCLNQDIIMAPNYLETLVNFMDRNLQVGAASGLIYKWNFTDNKKTKIIDSAGLELWRNHRVTDRDEGQEDVQQYNQPQEVWGVSGALPLLSRKALEQIKLKSGLTNEFFDEDFYAYKEDVDLAYRLRLAGWQAWFVPQAHAWHDRSIGNSQLKSQWQIARAHRKKNKLINYLSYRNHILAIYKNEFRINIWKNFFSIICYEARKLLFIILFNRINHRQFSSTRKLLPKMKKKRQQLKKIIKIGPADMASWYK